MAVGDLVQVESRSEYFWSIVAYSKENFLDQITEKINSVHDKLIESYPNIKLKEIILSSDKEGDISLVITGLRQKNEEEIANEQRWLNYSKIDSYRISVKNMLKEFPELREELLNEVD